MLNSYEARTLTVSDKTDILERDNYVCQYCGSNADSVDHIIPWSHCHNNSPFNLVAACQICNSVAGNKVFDTFMEKKNHVITRRLQMLSRRSVPIWTKAEVDELSGRIKDMVMSDCVVVENEAEGRKIAIRLAQDGFSVTFGGGDDLSPDDLLAAVRVVPNIINGSTCKNCGMGFYNASKTKPKLYCSKKCGDKFRTITYWQKKIKREAQCATSPGSESGTSGSLPGEPNE